MSLQECPGQDRETYIKQSLRPTTVAYYKMSYYRLKIQNKIQSVKVPSINSLNLFLKRPKVTSFPRTKRFCNNFPATGSAYLKALFQTQDRRWVQLARESHMNMSHMVTSSVFQVDTFALI